MLFVYPGESIIQIVPAVGLLAALPASLPESESMNTCGGGAERSELPMERNVFINVYFKRYRPSLQAISLSTWRFRIIFFLHYIVPWRYFIIRVHVPLSFQGFFFVSGEMCSISLASSSVAPVTPLCLLYVLSMDRTKTEAL